jgi:hypothetical protein
VADLARSHSATFRDAFHASIVSMRPRSQILTYRSKSPAGGDGSITAIWHEKILDRSFDLHRRELLPTAGTSTSTRS